MHDPYFWRHVGGDPHIARIDVDRNLEITQQALQMRAEKGVEWKRAGDDDGYAPHGARDFLRFVQQTLLGRIMARDSIFSPEDTLMHGQLPYIGRRKLGLCSS